MLSASSGSGQPAAACTGPSQDRRRFWREMELREKLRVRARAGSGRREGWVVGCRPGVWEDAAHERHITWTHGSCAWAPSLGKASTEPSSEALSLPGPEAQSSNHSGSQGPGFGRHLGTEPQPGPSFSGGDISETCCGSLGRWRGLMWPDAGRSVDGCREVTPA